MKMEYKDLVIESKYIGNKDWDSEDSRFHNWNNHRVVVTNKDSKRWCAFEYWESINAVKIQTESQLIMALYCFLSDAYAGYSMDYLEFCNMFGYDAYCKGSKRTYNNCKKSAEKVLRVMPGLMEDGDAYSKFMNEIQELYNL